MEQCPECGANIEQRPSLFTLKDMSCVHCGVPLRTNLRARLFFILSFSVLTAYHLYIKAHGINAEGMIVWGGMAAIIVPIIFTIASRRYEAGNQQSGYSLFVNYTFYAIVVLMAVLWIRP